MNPLGHTGPVTGLLYYLSKKDHLLYHIIPFQNISFLSIDVAFRKLETAKSVTSAYQQTAGLTILEDENWKIMKIICSQTPK
jgi:hypothetical protein